MNTKGWICVLFWKDHEVILYELRTNGPQLEHVNSVGHMTLACLPFDFLISWLLIESRNASFLEKLAQTFMEYRIALIVQQE